MKFQSFASAILRSILPVLLLSGWLHAQQPLQLRDGDRVVMVGDALIEQEQYSGWVELMLTTAFADSDVTFRNLGWSGDTPSGESRSGLSLVQAGREPPGEAWRQLEQQLELTQPSVAVLGYATASALQRATQLRGEGVTDEMRVATLVKFADDYEQLVNRIRQINPDCRFVFLTPISPVGESVIDEQDVATYRDLIDQLGKKLGGTVIDLTAVATDASKRKDAVHLNDAGYIDLAVAIQASLGVGSDQWRQSPKAEIVRQLILEKNRFWFHRSRPANMAYVFGFRKREQGQNAVEIPQFDPLIAEYEKRIAGLRSLKFDQAELPDAQLESQYAKFTPQPKPDFVVGDGLEITLWAENPLLNKPIHMNFDAQGRLWVVSSEAYPMIEVGQSLPDRVLILEDTDGDAVADKSTVFADELLIPTGIAPGDGGVYVAQSTDLLFLKDTDGDGKADVRRRVLSGFGTEDTHHNLHTLLFGPDGRLYMNQSVYTRTDAETPFGVVRLKAGGGFRYDTQRHHMDVFFRGLWNPWGHQFDAYGNSFMTDGAGFDGVAYVFPGARFNPTPGSRRQLQLISPGKYPKFCSGEIVMGESFPESWQGSLVTCDFRANRITRFSFDESGAGFATTQQADLVRTSESTFRPIDVKQGPDGALYVADWSNPIINHGEVDFRDPRRDRWHGRIWRIAFKDQEYRTPVDLTQQSIATLIGHLYSRDRYLSDHARRVLIDRKSETEGQLSQVWAAAKTPVDRLNALRLSASCGKPNLQWLSALLGDSDADARAAATRILSDWSDPTDPNASVEVEQALSWLSARVVDDHARTRLEAIRGLSRLGTLQAAKQSLAALDHPTDPFIDHALFLNVEEHADQLVADLDNPTWQTAKNQRKLEFVLTSIEPERATSFLRDYLANHPIARDGAGPWIDLIAKAGGPQLLNGLFSQVADGSLDDDATARALAALADARSRRKVLPSRRDNWGRVLSELIKRDETSVRVAAIRLAGVWSLRGLVPQLSAIASDSVQSQAVQVEAIRALRVCAAADVLVAMARAERPLEIQMELVAAIAGIDARKAVSPLYAALSSVDNEAQALALWRSVLGTRDGAAVLSGSPPDESISEVAARAGIRAAGESGRNAQSLVDALMPLSGLSMTAAEWTPQRLKEILAAVQKSSDAARGEAVYRRTQLQCTTCHAIGGVGGKVGPDLTSLGASAPIDYIVESMFDPNAKIKENYHSVAVLTEDGKVLSGIEVSSDDAELVLRDATDKLISIPQADVVEVKPGQSLMPVNLLDRVPSQDQIDLIRFLSQLGKPGEFDASRQNVARVVDVFAGTHRAEQAGTEDVRSGLREQGWKRLFSRVSGQIDKADVERATAQPINIALVNVYVRAKFELASATDVTFAIRNAPNVKFWIDGGDEQTLGKAVPVSAGKHTVVFQLDARQLPPQLVVHSDEVTFLAE